MNSASLIFSDNKENTEKEVCPLWKTLFSKETLINLNNFSLYSRDVITKPLKRIHMVFLLLLIKKKKLLKIKYQFKLEKHV